jgi:hypothetical protein
MIWALQSLYKNVLRLFSTVSHSRLSSHAKRRGSCAMYTDEVQLTSIIDANIWSWTRSSLAGLPSYKWNFTFTYFLTELNILHAKFYVLLTVHLDIIVRRKTNLMHNLFLVYFFNPYMFRAYLGPSSGGTTVCIQQLVLIILFRWNQVNQDNRHLSKMNNKYQLLYTHGCTSWWWA